MAAEIAVRVDAGEISVEQADAISFNIGAPNSAVSAERLGSLAMELCDAARVHPDGSAGLDVDHLVKLARMRREELDLESVTRREDEQWAARAYKLIELPTGAGRLILELDPESLVLVKETLHRAVSPKLRTVRFFDPTEQTKADTILADTRTPAQTGFDAIMQLLLLGADANPDFLLGTGAPQIRVTTTLKALESGDGIVRVEGTSALMSMRTLKRLHCSGGVTALIFDDTLQPLDVGREQRLFTKPQRIALAVKWGGCAMDGCDAPVSWCEAHHINEWAADHGQTDIADGILLCKHHHLLTHNNGWHTTRNDRGEYWLMPPPTVDPDQTPRLVETHNRKHARPPNRNHRGIEFCHERPARRTASKAPAANALAPAGRHSREHERRRCSRRDRRPKPGPLVLAAVLAMTISRNKLINTWRGRAEAIILLPVVGLATAGVGYLFVALPIVGAIAYVDRHVPVDLPATIRTTLDPSRNTHRPPVRHTSDRAGGRSRDNAARRRAALGRGARDRRRTSSPGRGHTISAADVETADTRCPDRRSRRPTCAER